MKKVFLPALLTIALAAAMVASLSGCAESEELKSAKADFTAQKDRVAAQQAELDSAIADGDALVTTEEKVLDAELIPQLETAVSAGKAAKYEVPEMPGKLEDITAKTSELKQVDCSAEINGINDAEKAVEDSIAKYKLVDQPTEAYVIQCLQTIPDIGEIGAVTEDNDPNGNLNKAGGYTATVYFTSPLVPQEKLQYKDDSSVVGLGTDGGGGIEVYRTPEEAQKRADYLAAFDGTITASGSHKVIGTVLVRTSNYLMASQQNALEQQIIDALTKLP